MADYKNAVFIVFPLNCLKNCLISHLMENPDLDDLETILLKCHIHKSLFVFTVNTLCLLDPYSLAEIISLFVISKQFFNNKLLCQTVTIFK